MANTPNLDLVKPAGTDHALVSVINSNSDKIDGGFGTLSEQIGMNAFGTKATIAALESALATFGGSMPNNSVRNIVFALDPAQGVFKNANYVGTISRTSSGRYAVTAQSHSSVQSGDLVVGVYANSAWSWRNVALNENGTWTPTIERATTANKTGKYQKIGNLYICTFSFDLSAIEAGSPYILGSSLPGYTSGTFTAIEGNWSSTGNEYGGMGNTSNNNVWFAKSGAVYGLSGSVNGTVRGVLTYMT